MLFARGIWGFPLKTSICQHDKRNIRAMAQFVLKTGKWCSDHLCHMLCSLLENVANNMSSLGCSIGLYRLGIRDMRVEHMCRSWTKKILINAIIHKLNKAAKLKCHLLRQSFEFRPTYGFQRVHRDHKFKQKGSIKGQNFWKF